MALNKRFRVQNVKTGKTKWMTDMAIQSMKKHNMFGDFDILPDVDPASKPASPAGKKGSTTPPPVEQKPKHVAAAVVNVSKPKSDSE